MTETPQVTGEALKSLRESRAAEIALIQDRIDEVDIEMDRLFDAGLDQTPEALALCGEALSLVSRLNSLIR